MGLEQKIQDIGEAVALNTNTNLGYIRITSVGTVVFQFENNGMGGGVAVHKDMVGQMNTEELIDIFTRKMSDVPFALLN